MWVEHRPHGTVRRPAWKLTLTWAFLQRQAGTIVTNSSTRTFQRRYFQALRKAFDPNRTHWTGWKPAAGRKPFAEIFPDLKDKVNDLQQTVEKIAPTLRRPGLVIIESPMGEGKTEAAMYLADHAFADDFLPHRHRRARTGQPSRR